MSNYAGPTHIPTLPQIDHGHIMELDSASVVSRVLMKASETASVRAARPFCPWIFVCVTITPSVLFSAARANGRTSHWRPEYHASAGHGARPNLSNHCQPQPRRLLAPPFYAVFPSFVFSFKQYTCLTTTSKSRGSKQQHVFVVCGAGVCPSCSRWCVLFASTCGARRTAASS